MRILIATLLIFVSGAALASAEYVEQGALGIGISVPLGAPKLGVNISLSLNQNEGADYPSDRAASSVSGDTGADKSPHSAWNILIMGVLYQYGVRPLSNEMFGTKL